MARRQPPSSGAPALPPARGPPSLPPSLPSKQAPPNVPKSATPAFGNQPKLPPTNPRKPPSTGAPPPLPNSSRTAPIVYRPKTAPPTFRAPAPSPDRGGPPKLPVKRPPPQPSSRSKSPNRPPAIPNQRQPSYERPIANSRGPPEMGGASYTALKLGDNAVYSEQTMELMDAWDNPEPQFAKPPPVAKRINKWQKKKTPMPSASVKSQKIAIRTFNQTTGDAEEDAMYSNFEKNRIRGMSKIPRAQQGYGFSERFSGTELIKQNSNLRRRSTKRFSMISLEDKLGDKTAFGYIADYMVWDCIVACVGCGLAGVFYGTGNTDDSFGGADLGFGMVALVGAVVLYGYREYYTNRPEPEAVPMRAIGIGFLGLALLPRFVTATAGILLLITAAVEYLSWRMGESYEYRKPRKKPDADTTISGRINAFFKHICAQTNRKKWGFAILWLGISVFIFIERYSFYYYAAYDETSKSFGYNAVWLGVAKGAGTVIDLNACCMLISVCRTFIRNMYNIITFGETSLAIFLRNIFQFIPLDKNLQWHKYMAGIVFAMTWVHVAAHLFNYGLVKHLVDRDFGAQIFVTGIVLVILTHVIFCTSFQIVRMNKFEFFWYTHHLFVFYFLFNLVHGRNFWGPNFWKYFLFPGAAYTAERLLREFRSRQPVGIVSVTHMETKKAKVFALELEKKGSLDHFRDGQYAFLKCMAVSQYQWHPFTIASAPEQKTAVFMIRRTGDTTWTGRTQDYLKALGPKNKVYHKLEMRKPNGSFAPRTIGPDGNQIICVDGPYAAPTQHCVEYYAAIIVGGGIGVTPLRATLQSLVHYKFKFDLGQSFPNYGYFHWGLRWADLPTYSFMFRTFREVSDEWENLKYRQKDIAERKGFEFHLWITKQPDTIPPFSLPNTDELSRWGPEFESPEARSARNQNSAQSQQVTAVENKKCGFFEADFFQAAWCGEECRVGNFFFHRGRARWDEIFTEVKQLHAGACNKVAVPICGPKALGNSLKDKCAAYSDESFEFVLHRENF